MQEIKVEKRIHKVWNEKAHEIIGHKLVGKYQYIYSMGKNEISLVKLYGYPVEKGWDSFQWEIYDNDILFTDVERYNTKEEAESRIYELLLIPMNQGLI